MARPLLLDRELCFKKWVELGRQENVSKWFADQGILNPKGKPVSRAAISYAARRWVCFNAEEARKYYNDAGWYPDDELWDQWLVNTAQKCFHSYKPELFREFLKKNGLYEKYGYIIGEGYEP